MLYTLTRSSRRTIAIQVMPTGEIVVKAPRLLPRVFIDRFVQQHAAWIAKKQAALKSLRPVVQRTYAPGDEFLYLGNTYRLMYGNYKQIAWEESELRVPSFLQFRIKEEITRWYRQTAREQISQLVKRNAQTMHVFNYGTITFSDTISKWGSCTHDNKLQFNWRLIMAPLLVINYVVIHELAHTIEKNHSSKFWSIVEQYTPSYRQQRKWLKQHGHMLHG